MIKKQGFAGLAVFACAAVASVGAQAFTVVPVAGKAETNVRMLDARVNLKDSLVRSAAARPGALDRGRQAAGQQVQATTQALASWQQSLPALRVRLSEMTGSPASVVNLGGSLSAAAPGRRSEDIVRDFLTQHGAAYGLNAADVDDLVALGDSAGGSSGLRMLRIEQRIAGVPVFQSESRFLLDRSGRVMKSVGQFVPHARAAAPAVEWSKLIGPETAVSRLLAAEGRHLEPSAIGSVGDSDGWQRFAVVDDYVAGETTARKVLFPLAPGMLVPAWALTVFTTGEADWYAVVDAQTGDLLWRKNIRAYASNQDARFRVYVQADGKTPADSPSPLSPTNVVVGSGTQAAAIAPTIVSMHTAYDSVASPNGWIDDCPGGGCTANETQTLGNNVLVCMDQVQGANANVCDTSAAAVIDGNGRPTGNPDANGRNRDFLGTTPRDFQTGYLPPPQGGNPESGQTATGNGTSGTAAIDQFRRGMITHLFYVTNWYHDQLYKLGFDEASGNFQQTNFSGQGLGGDRVQGDADDGSGTNNANFSTPADGTAPRMQMYRFTGPTIDRDGALDAEVSMHEMTHGTSNRLVGNGSGLNWDEAAGMGEGWSDFYALSLLNNTNADDPNARYASGGYATYKLGGYTDNYVYGIRRFPYSTDNSVNPMTWADVDDVTNDLSGGMAPDPLGFNGNGGFEVHNIGEVWMLSLWEVRSRIIADPAGANGDVPTGNHTSLQLMTDGLKATPIDPTFTDARDAILDADCATNACANEDSIWGGFADRGLGYGASTPYFLMTAFYSSHMAVKESFSLPKLDVADATTDVVVDDSATNANAVLDAGETAKLSITLTNPWRRATRSAAGVTATLTSATPGVTVYQGTVAYGSIAPASTAIGSGFVVGVGAGVACGSPIDFTLTTTSSLGTTSTTFRLRVGTRNGTDAPVTYSSSPALAIPDGTSRGVTTTKVVTDDYEIADLNVKIDSLTHTWDGDLTAMLRSPDALGVDIVAMIGYSGNPSGGGSSGANLTNMVIDDDVAFTSANNMLQATVGQAPYTQSWLPAWYTPFVGASGIGDLARYDGHSTKGTWTFLVSDGATPDTGTLNTWSFTVTPRHFDCAAVAAPSVAITATKTVAGTFAVGGSVVYTIVLTNTGTGMQQDNAGNEFSDVLPAGLSLVSASATSGVAGTAGNTVSWNGSLAPLGGSVTLTITATVNPGAAGTSISNQGTVNFDADVNGNNESTLLTDDPTVVGATDPTVFTVPGNPHLTLSKSVSGNRNVGDTMTYTIVIANDGTVASPDIVATDELTDVLPASLTLVDASATAGAVLATVGTNTVTWNGAVPAGGSVTVTVHATIKTGQQDQLVSNQASVSYDADLNGTAETTVLSDDPGVGGATDPTVFTVTDRLFYNGFE